MFIFSYGSGPEKILPADSILPPRGKYSWVKSPRFQERPMQVDPLAQMLVGYAGGHPEITRPVDYAVSHWRAAAGSLKIASRL